MVRITLCDSRDGCYDAFEGQFDDDPEDSSWIRLEEPFSRMQEGFDRLVVKGIRVLGVLHHTSINKHSPGN